MLLEPLIFEKILEIVKTNLAWYAFYYILYPTFIYIHLYPYLHSFYSLPYHTYTHYPIHHNHISFIIIPTKFLSIILSYINPILIHHSIYHSINPRHFINIFLSTLQFFSKSKVLRKFLLTILSLLQHSLIFILIWWWLLLVHPNLAHDDGSSKIHLDGI